MTEKKQRFENRLCKYKKYFNVLNPVWDNKKKDALNVFDMIDLLNDFDEAFNNFEIGLNELKVIGDYQAERIEELEKENEQLKRRNKGLQSELQIFKENVKHSNLQINKLADENEKLKQQKPFLKIHDDYFIQYGDDNELFNLHKPSDIRSLIYLINRENGHDELECEYNEEGYGND